MEIIVTNLRNAYICILLIKGKLGYFDIRSRDFNMANELFTVVPRQVSDLLSDVMSGRLGLPDLQRPFVWKDNKVRELLDSMLKGFHIGFVMLWESPINYENKSQIGGECQKFFSS